MFWCLQLYIEVSQINWNAFWVKGNPLGFSEERSVDKKHSTVLNILKFGLKFFIRLNVQRKLNLENELPK